MNRKKYIHHTQLYKQYICSSTLEKNVVDDSRRASTDLLPNLTADEQEFFTLVAMGEVKAVEAFLSVSKAS